MATQPRVGEEQVWAQIEREKRIDRRLRRVSTVAWSFTLLLTVVFAVLTGMQAALAMAQFTNTPSYEFGTILTGATVANAVLPLVVVLMILSTLIATLSTVGIFLRLRTASLQEIQMRLAALEAMLTRDDSANSPRSQRG
jgi:hypothetical protein